MRLQQLDGIAGTIQRQQCLGVSNRRIMIVQRVGEARAELAQIRQRLFRIVAQYIRVADEEGDVVRQLADLRLRFLKRGDGRG